MHSRSKIQVCSHALVHNYRLIAEKCKGQFLLPMVKANAYGHGAVWAVQSLLKEKNLYGFGVATFQEAIELRTQIKNLKTPILIFSDSAPWSHEKSQLCLKYQLEPVFSDLETLKAWYQNSNPVESVSVHWEFNTGMNRLGLPVSALSILNRFKRYPPKSIFTHFAESEAPNSMLTKLQLKNWNAVIDWAKQNFPTALLHASNSAAIWNLKFLPLLKTMSLARPGLSLYGVRPFEKAKDDSLKRVMHWTAPVAQVIPLKKGDRVGYNGIYKASRDERIATVYAGYADGVFRASSNQGIVVLPKGEKTKILGRVSMDLCSIKTNTAIKIGERVEFWGDRVDPYEVARLSLTNPYEIMTRIGMRVTREQVSSEKRTVKK